MMPPSFAFSAASNTRLPIVIMRIGSSFSSRARAEKPTDEIPMSRPIE
ncbi:MAG: hypothetical protein RR764_01335 [Oscillospiraceae bacterium]